MLPCSQTRPIQGTGMMMTSAICGLFSARKLHRILPVFNHVWRGRGTHHAAWQGKQLKPVVSRMSLIRDGSMRVISATCQNGERQERRFPRGAGARPAMVTLDRDAQRLDFVTAQGPVDMSGNPQDLFSRVAMLIGSSSSVLYTEHRDQGKGELLSMRAPSESDDPSPFPFAASSVFFGRVMLDENGTPSRLKLSITQGTPLDPEGSFGPALVRCIAYQKLTSVAARQEPSTNTNLNSGPVPCQPFPCQLLSGDGR